MLTPYYRPQDTITQILRNAATPVVARRNPVVIGPQYLLQLNDGRALHKVAYNNAGVSVGYKLADGTSLDLAKYTPQASGVRMFGEGLEAVVATLADNVFELEAGTTNALRLVTNDNVVGGTLNTGLKGRAVKIGDVFDVVADGVHRKRTVTGFLPKLTASSNSKSVAVGTSVLATTLTVTGTYTGSIDRRYVVKVTTGGASLAALALNVYDTTGTEGVVTITSGNATGTHTLGTLGLSFALSAGAYVAGDKFYIDAVAATQSTNESNGVVLSGPVVGAGYSGTPSGGVTLLVNIYQPYTGELNSSNLATGYAFTATDSALSYHASLGLSSAAAGTNDGIMCAFATGVGYVFFSYKALVKPGNLEGPIAITSSDTMEGLVGEANVENWLGRGVFEAFSGNQKQRVYAVRTEGDTVEAFTAALRKLRTTDVYYALAAMTDSLEVKQLVAAHADEMSNKFNKNFRRCYVGTDSPGAYPVWGTKADGTYRKASVAAKVLTVDSADRSVSIFHDSDIGSVINIAAEGPTANYTITAVYSAYEVGLDIAIGAAVTSAPFTMTRADSADNTVRFLQEQAAALGSRRCVNVWCESPTSGTEVVPSKFIAAEIAGLRCALMPQQGLTMTEIKSVDSAPAMYVRFTPEQLDEIAAAGNMIVMQESEGGEIFIRHQLTTDTSNGALAYEDNVGVIVDTFSYQVKDAFRAYIGKRNATANTIEEISTRLHALATAATQVDLKDADIGPMAIRFFDEDGKEGSVTVRIDGDLADHLLTYVKLRVPLPLNGINHYVDVETSTAL